METKTLSQKGMGWIKKHPIISIIGVIFIIGLIGVIVDGPVPQTPVEQKEKQIETKPVEDPALKKEAQDQLDAFMKLSTEARIVKSYEFSDTAVVVYVDNGWYGQTVEFKKNFISKVGTLKKAVTGYTHFELRDAYSNEMVGEIKSFSQSVEVYK